jgi:hypothetical protein
MTRSGEEYLWFIPAAKGGISSVLVEDIAE